MKPTITSIKDIKILVDNFYEKVRQDDLLAPVFNRAIQSNWPQHLEKMYAFWQTLLLREHTYYGSPFLPHTTLPIEEEHFARWLELFEKTLEEKFDGKKAEEAKQRAHKMAEMFQLKIEYHRENNSRPLL